MSVITEVQAGFDALIARARATTAQITGAVNGDLTTLTTTAKGSLIAAINEVKGIADGAASGGLNPASNLSDVGNTATALTNLGGLTEAQVDARAQAILDVSVGAAPGTLDTIQELATSATDQETAIGGLTTAVNGRLSYIAAQTLSAAEQQQGQDNLQVYSRTEIGDPATDLGAYVTAGLNA